MHMRDNILALFTPVKKNYSPQRWTARLPNRNPQHTLSNSLSCCTRVPAVCADSHYDQFIHGCARESTARGLKPVNKPSHLIYTTAPLIASQTNTKRKAVRWEGDSGEGGWRLRLGLWRLGGVRDRGQTGREGIEEGCAQTKAGGMGDSRYEGELVRLYHKKKAQGTV